MRAFFFLFISIFLATACSNTVDKPENLLSENQMVAVLTDVFQYQQPTYVSVLNDPQINHAKIDAQILKKHGINPKNFEESFTYYVLVPEKYKIILAKVRENLEAQLPEEERKRLKEEKENAGKAVN